MELGAPTLDVLVARSLWLGIDFDVLSGPPSIGRAAHDLVEATRAHCRIGQPTPTSSTKPLRAFARTSVSSNGNDNTKLPERPGVSIVTLRLRRRRHERGEGEIGDRESWR